MAERPPDERAAPEADAGTSGRGTLLLGEVRPAAILQLQAWPDTLTTVEAVVTQMSGVGSLPTTGYAAAFDGGTIMALGAGRYVIALYDAEIVASWRTAFSTQDAAIVDISHGRTIFSLEGEATAELLSRCAPIDLRAETFPPGCIAQTAIHHIDVLIHRCDESHFDIWALRSFAESLVEWLIDAGAELGIERRA